MSETGTQVERPATAWATVQHVPGLTYRRFDHWCTKGYIDGGDTNPGMGIPRTITPAEIEVLRLMTALVDVGLLPKLAARLAREMTCGQAGTLGGFRIMASSLTVGELAADDLGKSGRVAVPSVRDGIPDLHHHLNVLTCISHDLRPTPPRAQVTYLCDTSGAHCIVPSDSKWEAES